MRHQIDPVNIVEAIFIGGGGLIVLIGLLAVVWWLLLTISKAFVQTQQCDHEIQKERRKHVRRVQRDIKLNSQQKDHDLR